MNIEGLLFFFIFPIFLACCFQLCYFFVFLAMFKSKPKKWKSGLDLTGNKHMFFSVFLTVEGDVIKHGKNKFNFFFWKKTKNRGKTIVFTEICIICLFRRSIWADRYKIYMSLTCFILHRIASICWTNCPGMGKKRCFPISVM